MINSSIQVLRDVGLVLGERVGKMDDAVLVGEKIEIAADDWRDGVGERSESGIGDGRRRQSDRIGGDG